MEALPEAQFLGVDPLQTDACLRGEERAQARADFLPTQHDGQCLAVPRPNEREDQPRSL